MKYMVTLCCLLVLGMADSTRTDKKIERKIKTIYDASTGKAANQSATNKGWHQVSGRVKLSAGRATVTVNSSITDGKQDLSFYSVSSYRGTAFPVDTGNSNTYTVVPINNKSALIKSSSGTDTSTVRYVLEGE